MDPRTRASLLWGAAGALTFLVLAQTTRLFGPIELGMGLPKLLPVALAVFAVSAWLGYVVEGRLAQNRQV
ncbi:MAG: hypothetical protein ACQEQJ_01070 [Halobacteriota archaeon]